MKYSEGKTGRVFVLRLEHGDRVPGTIEDFAKEKSIRHAQAFFVGGLYNGEIVTGPHDTYEMPPIPQHLKIEKAHEVLATGFLAPDNENNPILHIHGALGAEGDTKTGCLRPGIDTWLVGEVVLFEILDIEAEESLTKNPDLNC
jgi:predicted DNA-binding protein with PD1-like motif